jgi:RimJ/RimL family protein N-acetyltransferase
MTPVDEWFAYAFNVPISALWAPGTHITEHVYERTIGRSGAIVFRRNDTTLVTAPPALVSRFHEAAAHGEDLSSVPVMAARFSPERTVQGPSWWGFADHVPLRPHAASQARRLAATDDELVASFRNDVGPEAWEEGGFLDEPPYIAGVFDRNESLVSMACLNRWRTDADDIGVCTHPGHRNRGYGRAAVYTAASHAIETAGVVRYRSHVDNAASIRIAEQLGFGHYGLQVAITEQS